MRLRIESSTMSTNSVIRAGIDGDTETRRECARPARRRAGASHRPPATVTDVWHRKSSPMGLPNAATLEAMKELEEGSGERFDTAEERFRDLGL